MRPIWVVDDDHSIRWVLQKAIAREGLPCEIFASAAEVLDRLETETPQVLVSDIRMPGQTGLTLLSKVRDSHPSLPVIIMTAYSDLDSAVAAFQGGAFEYLPKPFDVTKAVELILRAAREGEPVVAHDEQDLLSPEILGHAPAMQEVFRAIGRLSQSNVTVLITGESGSGKELVAKALHRHSPRAAQPFIALNTAAIPKDLLESELFGHERGAFTGAQATRRGRFEQAEGGTLFLDEIGDMPSELQTRLLRVLSDGHFYRVGGQQPIKANVRVIAATHQDLESRVKQGLFREDLFHRLNVIRLRLPPLRERASDVALLSRYFLSMSAKELGTETKRLSEAALGRLEAFSFPGNVRQLENICRWITVMAPAQVVEDRDLPPEVKDESGPVVVPVTDVEDLGGEVYDHQFNPVDVEAVVLPPTNGKQWDELLFEQAEQALLENQTQVMETLAALFETTVIQAALKVTGGKKIEAAQRLGIGRNTITRKIQELKSE